MCRQAISAFTIRSAFIPLPGSVVLGSLKKIRVDNITVEAVPIPATLWLFGARLPGLIRVARRRTTCRISSP